MLNDVKDVCSIYFFSLKILEIAEMCSVSLFESEELVKNLKPLDLTEAGHRSWIDQVILYNQYIINILYISFFIEEFEEGRMY